jgi:hypothetical protein
MSPLRSFEGGRSGGRLQKQLDEPLLVFNGQPNHLRLIDRPKCDFLRRGHHEIAETATLQFRGVLWPQSDNVPFEQSRNVPLTA